MIGAGSTESERGIRLVCPIGGGSQQRARKRDHDHAVVPSYSGNGSTDRVSEIGPCGAIVFGERLTRESEIRP